MANPNYSLVMVVGAGASKEVGLPIGAELKDQIAETLNHRIEDGHISGNNSITNAIFLLNKRQRNVESWINSCRKIADAMPLAASIDNFLDAHRSDGEIAICGKLAIAHSILKAESISKMHINNQNINNTIYFKALEETWYNSFFHLIVDGCRPEDIPVRLSRIAIISFNYDRCIEHFLYHSLRRYYPQIKQDQATKLLASLKIYHPYGYLGPLPWMNSNAVDFGGTATTDQLISIAQELKTFTEGTDEEHSNIIGIRSTMRSAERVVFLGFAFGEQNLELLYSNNNDHVARLNSPVYATAYGLSDSNALTIAKELHDISGHQPPSIHIRTGFTCTDLLREYGRSLKIR